MPPESSPPSPDPQKAPQPAPESRPDAGRSGGLSGPAPGGAGYVPDERRAQAYSEPPRFDGPPAQAAPTAKRNRWYMPVIAALILTSALGGIVVSNHDHSGDGTKPPMVQTHSHRPLQLSGADIDQAATDKAVSELRSGNPTPELAALPDQVKQELLSGERMFYRIPTTAPDGSNYQSGDQIRVDYNGNNLGTFDLSRPVTIAMPLKMGDQVGVHCVSVASGKQTLTASLATALNPVETDPLAPGMSESFSVQHSTSGGQNYEWFIQEAQSGNAVAQYGLGHMYQYGLAVQQNNGQAIHWYQAAAAQNYSDAKAQLQQLQGQ